MHSLHLLIASSCLSHCGSNLVHGHDELQVPLLTQQTAKASWHVDTPPAVEAAQPAGKAGAAKAGAGKLGVQADKLATPTTSGPLPPDALDEATPSGPVR